MSKMGLAWLVFGCKAQGVSILFNRVYPHVYAAGKLSEWRPEDDSSFSFGATRLQLWKNTKRDAG